MAERSLPTAGVAPVDSYLVDSEGRCVGQFVRSIVGTVDTYGATLEAEVAVAATGTLGTHGTAVRAIVSDAVGSTMTSALVAPLSIETYINNAPNLHVMMRFNTNAALDTPDAWFTGNAHCFAYSSAKGATDVAGGIRVKITGSNLTNTFGYLRVYQDA